MPLIMSNALYARRRGQFRRAWLRRYGRTARRYGYRRTWPRQYATYYGRIPYRRRGRLYLR